MFFFIPALKHSPCSYVNENSGAVTVIRYRSVELAYVDQVS